MQQITTQEQVEYASLGYRFAAVLVDTVVLVGLLIIAVMAYVFVLVAQGKIDPNDPAAVETLNAQFQLPNWVANVIVFGGLFVYYMVLEGIFQRQCGQARVPHARHHGGRVATERHGGARAQPRAPPGGLAALPAGGHLVPRRPPAPAPRRSRRAHRGRAATAGDERRRDPGSAPQAGPPGFAPPPAPPAPGAPPTAAPAWPAVPEAPPAAAPPTLDAALARLKTAALAARGAHLNYLRFSERELASGPADGGDAYSEEYVSAWFTLTEAVAELGEAREAAATAAASAAGRTLDEACAGQADLAHLLRELVAVLRGARRRGRPRGVPRRRPFGGGAPLLTSPRQGRPRPSAPALCRSPAWLAGAEWGYDVCRDGRRRGGGHDRGVVTHVVGSTLGARSSGGHRGGHRGAARAGRGRSRSHAVPHLHHDGRPGGP